MAAENSAAGPLAGLRVLELANFMAGPFCGLILADLGADVIKVEPPGTGDLTRQTPPFQNGESAGFLALNRNKRSLTLNLKHPTGRDLFLRLVETADVLIENFRPGTMADLGLDYPTLAARNPRLVYCAISGFGQTGPERDRPGLDLIVQAMSGLMSLTGEPDRPPVKIGVPLADLTTALFAANGIQAALRARDRLGVGQYLDLSLFESALALAVWETSSYFATGQVPHRLGTAHRNGAPYQAFPTADGFITIGAPSQRLFERLCAALDLPDLLTDPRFATPADRKANEQPLAEIISARTRREPSAVLLDRLQRAGVPAGPIWTIAEALASPQVAARGLIWETEHPSAGPVRLVGSPLHLSQTPATLRRPAPRLGEHTAEVLGALGLGPQEVERLRTEGVV